MKMPEPLNPPAPMKPTVGRIVHFHLGGSKPPYDPRGTFTFAPDQDTYAATVAAVDSDGLYVNLTVSDHYGNTFGRTLIPFVQPGVERPAGAWCEWPPIQNSGRAPKDADPFSRVQEKFQTQSGAITRADSLVLAAKGLQEVAADLDLKGRHPQAGRSSGELKSALLAIIPLIQHVADTLIGEPPTLNTPTDAEQLSRLAGRTERERTPVRDPQKLAEAIDMNERQAARRREDPDAPRLESDPERVQADLSRHPVIAAAQELSNDGRSIDEPGTGPFDSPAPTIPQD